MSTSIRQRITELAERIPPGREVSVLWHFLGGLEATTPVNDDTVVATLGRAVEYAATLGGRDDHGADEWADWVGADQ